jgi:solute carrier family 35 (adenosine 3'-phospho 5'-phosphosulfate transporter), member B3
MDLSARTLVTDECEVEGGRIIRSSADLPAAEKYTLFGGIVSEETLIIFYGVAFFIMLFIHDALQELLMKRVGSSGGSFLAILDCVACFLGPLYLEPSILSKIFQRNSPGRQDFLRITFLVYGSVGFSSIALGSVAFPLKVVIKSCKLVPTMVVAGIFMGKKFPTRDYFFAIMLCIGLAGFTAADWQASAKPSSVLGILLLLFAILCDAIAPNLQDRLMNVKNFSVYEVMGNTNFYCSIVAVIFFFLVTPNPLVVLNHIFETDFVNIFCSLVYGSSTFFGVTCYMNLVKHSGGVGAVVISTTRKIATICMSFVFFPKPLSIYHFMSGILIFGTILLRTCVKS